MIRQMRQKARNLLPVLLLALDVLFSATTRASEPMAENCRTGAYRLMDGQLVTIGPGEGAHLRWRRVDGTTGELSRRTDDAWSSTLGWTGRPDGIEVRFPACANGQMNFNGIAGKRIALDITNTRFHGAGVILAGRLVMPKGKDRVPLVVLVHGSEHDSALDFYDLQRMFPALGIGVFVYDKRGTGLSGGTYTQNYLLLANDVIAAVHEARRLAGERAGRIGYQAGSQGGWVAPLAARIEPVDFVVVGFGLAVSPLEEDREAIVYDMQRNGFGQEEMTKAMEVADASANILLSNFRSGYDRLDALKEKYGNESWFRHVHGDVTFALLAMSQEDLKQKGPVLFEGIPLQYDPMPVLQNLTVPQLWILGGEDADAPSAQTIRRLRGLRQSGRPIALAIFPNAEHGICEFETKVDGTRVDTRNSEGYFRLMRDYIFGRVHGMYGQVVYLAAATSPAGHQR